jgi:hypothetical protein
MVDIYNCFTLKDVRDTSPLGPHKTNNARRRRREPLKSLMRENTGTFATFTSNQNEVFVKINIYISVFHQRNNFIILKNVNKF